ncbi:MAG: hypothetical protein ACXQTY_05265 [Candidatus Methanogasteraceae archaeon]|uniref:Uncharacterized protein n=1 Tax=Candidatus Methanogaster sp. ANME-2c ERB4 TaxID=2759911 RepID=A0A7G9Y2G5_9EURY|nr:hypothetical protein OONBJFFA_00014 [Methanosarcinales archaeon ANME-2c ERB4]QNO45393.1 hypothetical protein AAMIBBNB_00002 [Methanosarcinales archaeon ANME-2c ERB4]QNO45617.1 hypothetical protein JMABOEBK_00014 [Methanosarcinales archaeon ANME-2c ERB4]
MTEKRIPCEIIAINEGKTWNNIVVEQKASKKRLFFGKTKKDMDINVGDPAYLMVDAMQSELSETPLRVTLYNKDGTKVDWTIIQPSQFNIQTSCACSGGCSGNTGTCNTGACNY